MGYDDASISMGRTITSTKLAVETTEKSSWKQPENLLNWLSKLIFNGTREQDYNSKTFFICRLCLAHQQSCLKSLWSRTEKDSD